MGLNELVAISCASFALNGTAPEACNKAGQAFMLQSGATHLESKVNVYVQGEGQRRISYFLDKDTQGLLASAYVIGVKREIRFSTRRVPLVQKLSLSAAPGVGSISLNWGF